MFALTIRTPYQDVYSGSANSIQLATEAGEIEVFDDHSSLTASILFSAVVVNEEGKDETFLTRNGIFLFDNEKNKAVLLSSYCEKKSEVTYKSARDYADFIEDQLKAGHKLSDFQIVYLKDQRIAIEEQLEVLDQEKE